MSKQSDFKGSAGSVICYPSFSSDGPSWICLVGSGSESQDDLRQAYGGLGYELRERNLQSVAVFNVTEVELAATAIQCWKLSFRSE